jgi:BlaI family transcriptional regulator, penicillinase repressor
MDKPPLGEQQLEVLRWITDRAPVTAREVAEHFATHRGLARTTVLSVIDRLQEKGYLHRRRRAGVFHYSPRVPQEEVMQRVVRDFVEKTLGGSVSPFVAYLARTRQISPEELAELHDLVEQIRAEQESE